MAQLTDKQKQLYNLIDEILWNEWDPIGVNDIPDARDEYQSYTPSIFSMVLRKVNVEEIANKLYEIETGRMALRGNIDNCLRIAKTIKAL